MKLKTENLTGWLRIVQESRKRDEDDLVCVCWWWKVKKENVKKKVCVMDDVKQPSKAGMMCSFTSSIKIPGSETQVHHVISPKTILVCIMSMT